MTPLQICEAAAQEQGRTFDAESTFAAMEINCTTFHNTVVNICGTQEDIEPPEDPPQPNGIGRDYVGAFTTPGTGY